MRIFLEGVNKLFDLEKALYIFDMGINKSGKDNGDVFLVVKTELSI